MPLVLNQRCLPLKQMAKIESELQSLYMNPNVYSQVKGETKNAKGIRRKEGVKFSNIFDNFRSKTTDEIGELKELPVSEETVNLLMDEVRNAGDILSSRPFPDEIMRYKQSVRNFMNYVVKNSYALEQEAGIHNINKPGFSKRRGKDNPMDQTKYTKIQVIDKKLEDLAAMLLSSQMPKLKIVARLEEIQGLLIDLLQ